MKKWKKRSCQDSKMVGNYSNNAGYRARGGSQLSQFSFFSSDQKYSLHALKGA